MATLVLGAIGLAAGASFGGAVGLMLAGVGGYIGQQLGGSVDAKVLGSAKRVSEGPRLGDLSVQASSYGDVIPLLYGTVRVAGNIIWSTGLQETRQEDTQKTSGGKGGGGGTKVTTVSYTYASSFAVALSARSIAGVGRIWADGKLLRDATGRLAVGGTVRIYTGSETQLADPLIEAHEGIGQAPAYRGLAYVVFENLALGEYANRIPNLTFEVIADSGGTVALGDVVSDLAERAALRWVDVSALEGTVSGFSVARAMSYGEAIQALARVYHFDAVEREGEILFAPLVRAKVADIAYEDLLRGGADHVPLLVTRGQELELPREISVRHIDPARDYQIGLQRARRQWTSSVAAYDYDLPLVLSADQAKRAAEVELSRLWRARDSAAFSLGPAHGRLMPGDVVRITGGGEPLDLILAETECRGGVLACQAVAYASDVYVSGAVAYAGDVPTQTVENPSDTVVHLLNVPGLRASDMGEPLFYVAASSPESRWRGAMLYRSIDEGDSYEAITALPIPSVAGVALGVLPDGPTDFWDEAGEVVIELENPDMYLESRTALAVLNGANAALLGDEILQFREAVLDEDGNYVLRGLLRGRRGTEHQRDTHQSGERFLLLDAARVVAVTGSIGRQDIYKAVSAGGLLNAAMEIPFAVSGENLKPFAPVHVTGSRNGIGDLEISWLRRTRADGGWIDGADVSLGEEFERYEVEILDGGGVLRILTVGDSNAVYTAADQLVDFGTLPADVGVRIYQMSARVGRGVAAIAWV